MKPRRLRTTEVCRQRFVKVHEHQVAYPGKSPHAALTLELFDWVSVAAITEDGSFVLVEQYRHGVDDLTLEPAGGIIDEGEEPAVAGLRELEEETGYVGTAAEPLGWVHPNPALQGNRSFFFLAASVRSVRPPEQHDDERTRVVVLTRPELEQAIESGRISHALGVLCLMRALRRTGSAP